MKLQNIFSIAAIAIALSASAEAPVGYYSALEGLSGAALKEATKHAVAEVTTPDYGEMTWEAFQTTDVRDFDGMQIWWDMYSNKLVAVSTGHGGLNIEHSVANSWWGGIRNDAYKDLHHLNPSDATANGWKSNYPLGIVKTVFTSSAGTSYDNGVTKVGLPESGLGGGAKYVFEPHDAYKGDFARAYFYMFTMYDDIEWLAMQDDRNFMFDGSAYPSLRPWAVDLLLDWARQDPVDTKEIARNDAVFAAQGNRNPFIDNPGLEEYIWGTKSSTPFAPLASYTPAEGVYPEPQGHETVDGKWQLVRSLDEVKAGERYVILSAATQVFMKPEVSSSWLAAGTQVQVADGSFTGLPTEAAIVRVEPLEEPGTYALRIEDGEGEVKGYVCSTTAKKLSLKSDSATAGVSATLSFTEEGDFLADYGAAGRLQYNTQSPRFLTYTSSQEGLRLYREADDTPNGLDGITDDASSLVSRSSSLYDLNGRLLPTTDTTTLLPGLYIVRTPFKSYKLIIR